MHNASKVSAKALRGVASLICASLINSLVLYIFSFPNFSGFEIILIGNISTGEISFLGPIGRNINIKEN